jgi:hypothetical protein
MKQIYLFLLLLLISFTYEGIFAQDALQPPFRIPVTYSNSFEEYNNLPQVQENINYKNPNTTTRVIQKNGQRFTLSPNIRPFPSTVTQTEVDAANMKGNDQIIYAAWNSFGSSFFGTGFCYSSDGGASWTGNFQTFLPNPGDPGPWIWPAGSQWAGRLGLSVISGAGYSTNAGANWVNTALISNGGFDKNFSAVDDITGSPFFGRAYTLWTSFSPNSVSGSFTTDGGQTWSTAVTVRQPSGGRRQIGVDLEAGPSGIVYAVWANFDPGFTVEDSLGFAKSTDGGVSWVSNNGVLDINGIYSQTLFNGIRANGLPRLAIDNTGGPRNGWIYVTTGEKNISPATDVGDICLCRSTNGGVSWTHTRVNQDAPGSGRFQYFADIDVVPDGSVVTSYYDQRNTTGFVTEYWMSRSTDGGDTWVDVAVSDHSFTPVGLISNYQGDYTGITTANNKIWPFWADNSSGIYQVWTVGIDYNTPPIVSQLQSCKDSLNKIIPDPPSPGAFDTISLNIPNSIVVEVRVKIDTVLHTNDSDLMFTLTHEAQNVPLISAAGGSGDNFIVTYLYDSAPTAIANGSAPFTGKFKPSSPLSAFINMGVSGTWILQIQDVVSGNTGLIKSWCIQLFYQTLLGNIETVEIPNHYFLGQNYPNPFNPVTTIKYGIPKTSNVLIRVYDVLGNEVSTLVNEKKNAGVHTASFNASNLSSGVYFYKIEVRQAGSSTGNFTDVKKMVLIK